MALNEAYGRTDVEHDPNWIMANYKGRKREQMLRNLQIENERAQQNREFELRQAQAAMARSQARDLNDENRSSREMMHNDNMTATTSAREAQQAGLKEAHDTQRAQQLQIMAADPNLGKPAQDAAKAELIKLMGLTVAAPSSGAKGEYGPGGAPKGVAPTAPTTSYNTPTDAFKVDAATGVGSGATSPADFRKYQETHSTVNADGLRSTTLPSGGIAKAFDRTTSPGRAKIGASNGFTPTPFPDTTAATNPPPNENAIAKPISGYTPPTSAFTEAVPAQPQAAATPASNVPAPGPNPTPAGTPYVGPFSELNVTAPAVAPAPTPFIPPAVPTPPPVLNPQASNDKQDLLKDTENTFYGGGQSQPPAPTPTPTPVQNVASTQPHPMTPQALAYLRLLGLA